MKREFNPDHCTLYYTAFPAKRTRIDDPWPDEDVFSTSRARTKVYLTRARGCIPPHVCFLRLNEYERMKIRDRKRRSMRKKSSKGTSATHFVEAQVGAVAPMSAVNAPTYSYYSMSLIFLNNYATFNTLTQPSLPQSYYVWAQLLNAYAPIAAPLANEEMSEVMDIDQSTPMVCPAELPFLAVTPARAPSPCYEMEVDAYCEQTTLQVVEASTGVNMAKVEQPILPWCITAQRYYWAVAHRPYPNPWVASLSAQTGSPSTCRIDTIPPMADTTPVETVVSNFDIEMDMTPPSCEPAAQTALVPPQLDPTVLPTIMSYIHIEAADDDDLLSYEEFQLADNNSIPIPPPQSSRALLDITNTPADDDVKMDVRNGAAAVTPSPGLENAEPPNARGSSPDTEEEEEEEEKENARSAGPSPELQAVALPRSAAPSPQREPMELPRTPDRKGKGKQRAEPSAPRKFMSFADDFENSPNPLFSGSKGGGEGSGEMTIAPYPYAGEFGLEDRDTWSEHDGENKENENGSDQDEAQQTEARVEGEKRGSSDFASADEFLTDFQICMDIADADHTVEAAEQAAVEDEEDVDAEGEDEVEEDADDAASAHSSSSDESSIFGDRKTARRERRAAGGDPGESEVENPGDSEHPNGHSAGETAADGAQEEEEAMADDDEAFMGRGERTTGR